MSYTPGPWNAQGVTPASNPQWPVLAVCSNSGTVCAVTSDAARQPKEAEANARLIAAAPELLEACQELIRLADDGALIGLADVDATPISRRLRAALAKATAT